jgi:hypothetical protein
LVFWLTDFKDKRKLVGAVNNVFIGKVISQGETIENEVAMPQTLFNVEVLENIKGKLTGVVQVRQFGGFDKNVESVVLMDQDPLLQPNQTYLFATVNRSSSVWHTLVSNYGDIPIKDAVEYKRLTQEFKQAHAEEIPLLLGEKNYGIPYIQK